MKLIYKPHKTPWWHGLRVECPDCGKVEQMDPGDDKLSRVHVSFDGVTIYCDCCGRRHDHAKPEARHD